MKPTDSDRTKWQGVSILGIVIAIVILLAACAPAATSPTVPPLDTATGAPTAGGSQEPTAQTAGPSGTLTIALPDLREETFLPWSGALARKVYAAPLFDHLVHMKHDTWEFIPALATKWETSPDGKTVTFTIRQGVPWNNGQGEVTAEDVKFTFDRIMAEDSKNIRADYFRGIVDRIEAPSNDKVVFYLKRPDVALISELSPMGSAWIVPKDYVEKVGEAEFEKNPVGSGPYRFVELKSGDSIKYEAVPNHWRVTPEFQTLIYRAVPEESTRLAMLRTGEIDIAPLSADSAAQLTNDTKISVKSNPKSYSVMLMFGGLLYEDDKRFNAGATGQEPWSDPRVRKAMNMAIDRDAIVKAIYKGNAAPSTVGWMTPGWDEQPPIQYDPTGAKALLAEAGYPNGFDISIPSYPLSPGSELPVVVEAVAQYLEAVGIRTRIAPEEFANFRKTWGEGKTEGLLIPFRAPMYWDWEAHLRSYVIPDGSLPAVSDPKVLDIMKQLVGEPDVAVREKLFTDFSNTLGNDYLVIGIAAVSDVYGVSDRVGDWPALEGVHPIYQEYAKQNPSLKLFQLFEP